MVIENRPVESAVSERDRNLPDKARGYAMGGSIAEGLDG